MTSSKCNHSLKDLLPNTITLGVSTSTYNLGVCWGGAVTYSLYQELFVFCFLLTPHLELPYREFAYCPSHTSQIYPLDLYPTLSLSLAPQSWKRALNPTSKQLVLLKSVTQVQVFLTTGIDRILIWGVQWLMDCKWYSTIQNKIPRRLHLFGKR